MTNMALFFPKEKCTDVQVKGKPYIEIDVGMSAKEFILMFLEWEASGDKLGGVLKKKAADSDGDSIPS